MIWRIDRDARGDRDPVRGRPSPQHAGDDEQNGARQNKEPPVDQGQAGPHGASGEPPAKCVQSDSEKAHSGPQVRRSIATSIALSG